MRLKNFICAVAAALFGVALLPPASAQNLVMNGNFSSNATLFTTFPGYVGGSNPANVPGWTQISGTAGGYGVNGAGTVTSVFGPVNTGGNTFGFIQGTGKTLAQNLPSLAVNTSYVLSFLAAARNQSGESNDVFKVQIGDGASVFVTTGNVVATNAAFQNFSYPFTTPASFSGTPSLQLSNASSAGDHTVDFTSLSVLPANVALLVVFTSASGNWNMPGNWSSGVVPLPNHSPDILNGSTVTVNSSVGTCSAVFVGQGNQTPTGTVIFRSGGALAAGDIYLGRDGTNFGRITQTGGALAVNGTLNIGDAAGASGEYDLSGGTLSLTNPVSTVIVGHQGVGKMLVVGNSVLSAPNIFIGHATGAAGSKLFQWGGTIYAGNLTIGAAGVTNCAFTISGGATLWTGIFQVNNQLIVQGSQYLLQQTGSGGGLQLGAGAALEFDLDAQGVTPLQLTSSPIGINAASQLVVDGSKYVRWSGAPGSFTLVNHGGYSGATQFASNNITFTGFGDLTPSVNFNSNSIVLVLTAPTNGTVRVGQGIFCEYWQVPITVNPGRAGRSISSLSALPSFTNTLVTQHPVFGRAVTNINLSPRLQDLNYFMRFSGFISAPTNGSYTFYLNSDDGSLLWLDGNLVVTNDGTHAAQEISGTTNLAAGMHALMVTYFQGGSGQALTVSWAGPNFAKQLIPNAALFLTATPNTAVRQPIFQNVVLDSEQPYNYAPSFMYDETEGLYKIWMCGAGISGAVGGDNIVYREAASLEGLMTAPLSVALQPSLDPTKFDQVHACDPNVYRVGNIYYLAYGGNTDNSQLPATTRLGMASSTDGGRTFQRLNGGVHILGPNPATLDPNAYGIGQPAVVQAPDGFFYMIYTDANGNGMPDYQRVVRSLDPAFTPGSFTNVVSIAAAQIGGYSLDLAFDDGLKQFVVINGLTMIYYNTNWTEVRRVTRTNSFAWSFGEGHGLLTDSQRRPINYNNDGLASYVFAASTEDSTNDTTLWAPWVAGDLKYLIIPRAAPVIGAISTRTVTAGSTVSFQISATDAEVATSALNYTLVNPPAGATINLTNHFFSWRPTIAQSPSTNVITVKVFVNGSPTLSTTYGFLVIVSRPPAPTLSQTTMANGFFSVLINGVNGPDYSVWSSSNLANWLLLVQSNSPALPFTFTDSVATNFGQQFYRVMLGP